MKPLEDNGVLYKAAEMLRADTYGGMAMVSSKGWEWEKANPVYWSKPSEDGVYFAHRWSGEGCRDVLDLGAGLGRHAIHFAKQGLTVSAMDISEYAVNHMKEWAAREQVKIQAVAGDMTALPYADASFDCVFVYHAISHSDTAGVQKVVREIERVLRPGGQLFTSMCSKESWEYTRSGFPRLDENTVVCSDNGPEQDVPHFFADVDDILGLFANFTIEKIRHVDYCYLNGKKQDSKYYYLNGYKAAPQN